MGYNNADAETSLIEKWPSKISGDIGRYIHISELS